MLKLVIYYIIILKYLGIYALQAQNYIANPSFSEVKIKNNNLSPYSILPGNSSEVKDWYLLPTLDYKSAHSDGSVKYSSTYYYSSRDAELMLKKRDFTYLYSKFDMNLGYMRMYINKQYPVTVIQQKLNKPLDKGTYCFKFKYKYIRFRSERWEKQQKCQLEVSFSSTNLNEFYRNKLLRVPSQLIQVAFKDTINDSDENTPWQQKCYVINLSGNEKYISIGTLANNEKDNYGWAHYFIDDVELIKVEDQSKCNCEEINKDLSKTYKMDFPINKEISNDTLVMFLPNNSFEPGALTPQLKYYLYNLISFMQRNTDVKIKWIQYQRFNDLFGSISSSYDNIQRFLVFYGIDKSRISIENGLCTDTTGTYCGFKAEYTKFGFKFYKE